MAAGHPTTAEAGAAILREGGNAVDAAIASVLTSFVCESPLTGFGAGGFMLVHDPIEGEDVVLDFFCAAGGIGGAERSAELDPMPVFFDEVSQTFNVGAASCAVPGTAAGLELAARRFGSVPLLDLVRPGIGCARDGVEINRQQGYVLEILQPILTSTPESAAVYAPGGHYQGVGDLFRYPEMGDALELFGSEGAEPFMAGHVAEAVAAWVADRGGTLGLEDLRAYRPVERDPIRIPFRGTEVVTNPPSSSGGLLIAFALGVLERLGDRSSVEDLVAAMEAANGQREGDFHEALHGDGFAASFLAPERIDRAAERIRSGDWAGGRSGGGGPDEGLGSTTHVTAIDADGRCASVTCSNGTCSGLLVPGTGVHLNNMLGEEDLNPGGFHRIPPGRRVSSMMAPSAVLSDGEVLVGLGSAGSNRIRSAVVQTIVRVVEEGMGAAEAVEAGRLHFENDVVQAEPGVDPAALDRLEDRGVPVVRWKRPNLFFGGAQAVVRDPGTGRLTGGGDPRRGGAVAVA